MIDTIETLSSYSYLLLSLALFTRFVFFKNKNLWPSILLMLYILANILMGFCLVGSFDEIFSVKSYPHFFNAFFLALGTTFSSIIISHYVEDLTDKKLKTLLRLPLIGFLTGYALTYNQVLWGYMIIEILSFSLFYRKRTLYQYTFRAQLRSILCLSLLLLVDSEESLFISFYFITSYIFKIPIINAFIVKSKVMQYDKAHD